MKGLIIKPLLLSMLPVALSINIKQDDITLNMNSLDKLAYFFPSIDNIYGDKIHALNTIKTDKVNKNICVNVKKKMIFFVS